MPSLLIESADYMIVLLATSCKQYLYILYFVPNHGYICHLCAYGGNTEGSGKADQWTSILAGKNRGS